MDLASYLRAEGLTDTAFAALVGVNKSTVHRLKTGAFVPAPELALKIEAATGFRVRADSLNPALAEARGRMRDGVVS